MSVRELEEAIMAAEMEAAQLRPLSLPTPVRVPTVFFFGGGGGMQLLLMV
jgi:hypothetical protein